MKVSIVMPAYNSAAFIRESIESVVSQTYLDWELIVMDDASTDETADIVKSMEDLRILFHHSERNIGSAKARNHALKQAKGRYIAFLDSDDLWLPKKLEQQLSFMAETGCAICCTDYVKIDEIGDITSPPITGPDSIDYRILLRSNSIACSSAIVDRDRHPDLRMPDIKLNHDYALWLSLLRDGGIARRLPETLLRYRVHSSSLSRNKLESTRYNWLIYRKLEHLSWPRAVMYMGSFLARGLRKFLT